MASRALSAMLVSPWRSSAAAPDTRGRYDGSARTSVRCDRSDASLRGGLAESAPKVTCCRLRLAVRCRRFAGEGTGALGPLELSGDLVDQRLHLADEIRGDVRGLRLLAADPVILGAQRGHFLAQCVALPS